MGLSMFQNSPAIFLPT